MNDQPENTPMTWVEWVEYRNVSYDTQSLMFFHITIFLAPAVSDFWPLAKDHHGLRRMCKSQRAELLRGVRETWAV